jgi:hypothetical protein
MLAAQRHDITVERSLLHLVEHFVDAIAVASLHALKRPLGPTT